MNMKKIMCMLIGILLSTGVSLAVEILDDIVIGDFEDYPGQWPTQPDVLRPGAFTDNWNVRTYPSHGGAGIYLSQSTTGATLGNYSLKLQCPAEIYYETIIFFLYNEEHSEEPNNEWYQAFTEEERQVWIDGFLTHRSVSMDITIDPADWDPNMTCDIALIYNSEGGGPYDDQGNPDTDTLNPGNPSYWDAATFPNLNTRTVTWDITPASHALHTEYGGWFEIIMQVRTNGNGTQTATVYLDNIRLTTQYTSYKPGPYDTEDDLDIMPTLFWTPGVYATSHDVYFGTDFNEVNDATEDNHPNVTLTTVDVNELDITEQLEFFSPYYWRVDDDEGTQTFKGDVWTFNTGLYSLIDNFESYPTTKVCGSRIFEFWRDGKGYSSCGGYPSYSGNDTNMRVGVDKKPWGPETNIVYKGDQSLPLTYDNSKKPYISETDRTFDEPYDFSTINNMPIETLDMQIRGRFLVENGYSEENGQYTVTGSGSDIFGKEDEFHYVYQTRPLESPSGSISAKIISVENTNRAAKAGVMIRDLPEEPDAVYAAVVSLPNGDIVFQYRNVKGGSTTNLRPEDHEFTLPYWVKVSIDGSTVTGQMSADGQTWVDINEPQTVSMINYTVCGLAVSSHRNAGIPCTAVIEDVKIEIEGEAGLTVDTSVDVGLEKSDPADIYVRLEDNSGQKATVDYDDNPNGTIIVDPYNIQWMLFSIPLTEFTTDNSAIDLSQINKMTIGIGDYDENGQAVKGGEGKLYVDDVRLTLPALEE